MARTACRRCASAAKIASAPGNVPTGAEMGRDGERGAQPASNTTVTSPAMPGRRISRSPLPGAHVLEVVDLGAQPLALRRLGRAAERVAVDAQCVRVAP